MTRLHHTRRIGQWTLALIMASLALAVAASRADTIEKHSQTAEPRYAGYVALLRMLDRYRALARDSSLVLPPDQTVVRPNDSYADAPRLRRLLVALGDLPPDVAYSEPNRYAGALVLAL